MAVAKANRDEISCLRMDLMRTCEDIDRAQREIKSEIQTLVDSLIDQITSFKNIISNANNSQNKLSKICDKIKKQKKRYEEELKNTPAYIKETQFDRNGEPYEVSVSNPKYIMLRSCIRDCDTKLSKSERIFGEINRINREAEQGIRERSEAITKIEQISSLISHHILNQFSIVSESGYKLDDVIKVLDEYSNTQIEKPSLKGFKKVGAIIDNTADNILCKITKIDNKRNAKTIIKAVNNGDETTMEYKTEQADKTMKKGKKIAGALSIIFSFYKFHSTGNAVSLNSMEKGVYNFKETYESNEVIDKFLLFGKKERNKEKHPKVHKKTEITFSRYFLSKVIVYQDERKKNEKRGSNSYSVDVTQIKNFKDFFCDEQKKEDN